VNFFRSMGHIPNQFSAELDTREQRAIDLSERYAVAIAFWAEANGCEVGDLTPGQLRRFRAFEAAGCDVSGARGLLYGRLLHKTGRIT
jgi:hypothetical protein